MIYIVAIRGTRKMQPVRLLFAVLADSEEQAQEIALRWAKEQLGSGLKKLLPLQGALAIDLEGLQHTGLAYLGGSGIDEIRNLS